MASEAYGKVEKAMDAAREAELAAYIMRDVELRQQNAKEMGVLAYGKKPVPRAIPNQRFLQNTLKSVDFANRTARENEMWQQWESQKRPREVVDDEPKSKRKKRKKEKEKKRSHKDRHANLSEEEDVSGSESSREKADLDQLLTRTAPRGRGSTGPRSDETGPFLFPTDEQEREEYEMMRYMRKPAAGSQCPDWIRSKNAAESQKHSNSGSAGRSRSRSPERASALGKTAKSKRKHKAVKKEHKKKRRKDNNS